MSPGQQVLAAIGHLSELKQAQDHKLLINLISIVEDLLRFLHDYMDKADAIKARALKAESDRDSETARADSEKTRAEKAEADLATLQGQVAADEDEVKAKLDALNSEPAPAAPADPAPAPTPVVDAAAGTTTVAGSDGSTTTLDHSTGESSTVDASGAPVATDTAAHDAAVEAATDAGVSVSGA